jgi:hypothetical protein
VSRDAGFVSLVTSYFPGGRIDKESCFATLSLPGICARCFGAQKRTSHPILYYCLHFERFVLQIDAGWKTTAEIESLEFERAIGVEVTETGTT